MNLMSLKMRAQEMQLMRLRNYIERKRILWLMMSLKMYQMVSNIKIQDLLTESPIDQMWLIKSQIRKLEHLIQEISLQFQAAEAAEFLSIKQDQAIFCNHREESPLILARTQVLPLQVHNLESDMQMLSSVEFKLIQLTEMHLVAVLEDN